MDNDYDLTSTLYPPTPESVRHRRRPLWSPHLIEQRARRDHEIHVGVRLHTAMLFVPSVTPGHRFDEFWSDPASLVEVLPGPLEEDALFRPIGENGPLEVTWPVRLLRDRPDLPAETRATIPAFVYPPLGSPAPFEWWIYAETMPVEAEGRLQFFSETLGVTRHWFPTLGDPVYEVFPMEPQWLGTVKGVHGPHHIRGAWIVQASRSPAEPPRVLVVRQAPNGGWLVERDARDTANRPTVSEIRTHTGQRVEIIPPSDD